MPEDGGCDEGINYWWRAGGSLFECLETLASACGDDYGVFEIQKIRAIARYPVITHIADGWHVNFADGSPKPAATPHLLYRIGDQEVVRHARALRGDHAATDLLAGANGGPLSGGAIAGSCAVSSASTTATGRNWAVGGLEVDTVCIVT